MMNPFPKKQLYMKNKRIQGSEVEATNEKIKGFTFHDSGITIPNIGLTQKP